MKLGMYLRNMGPQATRATILECAGAAEDAGIDDLWVADHVAIPPDQSEGSDGRYLDPLATLAFLAAATRRIGLGTGVLVLPYRPAFATAKWVATIQELSGGRLRFGVGVGWMEAEFRVVGVPRSRRGAIADATLELVHRCFASDEVEENGQKFLFRPRPPRPPIYVGGAPPHAFTRTLRYGDGWMPTGGDPKKLAAAVDELRDLAAREGKAMPEVVLLTSLPLDEPERAAAQALAFREAGATALVHAGRYPDAATFARRAEAIAGTVRGAVGGA